MYERTLNASHRASWVKPSCFYYKRSQDKKRSTSLPLLKLPCSLHLLISDSFIGSHKFSLFVAEVLSPLCLLVFLSSPCSLFILLVHLQPLYWLPFIFPLLINLWIFRDKPSLGFTASQPPVGRLFGNHYTVKINIFRRNPKKMYLYKH